MRLAFWRWFGEKVLRFDFWVGRRVVNWALRLEEKTEREALKAANAGRPLRVKGIWWTR